MAHFLALLLMSFGSYFVAPIDYVSEENSKSITIIKPDKKDDVIRMGGAGQWDD